MFLQEMVDTAERHTKELGKIEGMGEEEAKVLYKTLGLGALKYFLLKVDPKKRMLFNPEESVDFNGNTGPFIQYTHARIRSILRKSDQELTTVELDPALLKKEDIDVLKQLYDFPVVLSESAAQKSPALIANYVYELVKIFNHFYQNTPSIVKEENDQLKNMRLSICKKTAEVISNSMGLLGISVPERM